MRIGISTAQCQQLAQPATVHAVARAAEQLGYSSVWVLDVLPAPLDPIGVLSATAAVTSRVSLGASVVVTAGDHPEVLVRALTTVDVLSEGRLVVALGLARGCPGSRLELVLDALDAKRRRVSPSRPGLPVLLTSHTVAGLELAARRADGWSPVGLPVEVVGPQWAQVRRRAESCGRDPEALKLVVRAPVTLTDEPLGHPRPSWHGDAQQVADDVNASRRMGADEVVLGLRGDLSLDQALDGYARIVEAAEARSARPQVA